VLCESALHLLSPRSQAAWPDVWLWGLSAVRAALPACRAPPPHAAACAGAGLYAAGARNRYFRPAALAPWLLAAAAQAGGMVSLVMAATAPTAASRADGSTWSHWEVRPPAVRQRLGAQARSFSACIVH